MPDPIEVRTIRRPPAWVLPGLVVLASVGAGRAEAQVGEIAPAPLPRLPSRPMPARPGHRPRLEAPIPAGAEPRVARASYDREEDESEVRYNGTPTPGSRITLALNGSEDPAATYLWSQIEGPPVAIDDPTRPRISLTIPRGTDRLRFLLTTRDRLGERSVKVTIPVSPEATVDPSLPRADAGDDQIGLAGRRMTLDGSRSRMASKKSGSYRWLQVEGPKVRDLVADRQFLTFTPPSPGHYRFILLVAAADVISDPDEVSVTIGEPPSPPAAEPPGRPYDRTLGLDPSTAGTLGLSGKPLADQVAEVFDSIADRAALYSSFDSLTSEMTRRLDAVIPKDPAARQALSQGVFLALSQRTAAELYAVGLDLRVAAAQNQPLTDLQKERLRKLFQAYAQEFRSVARAH